MRILVVDDHALIRIGLRHTLAALNDPTLEIVEAASCHEALALADSAGPIDLILLDLNLPDVSGLEGIDQFSGAHPDVPLLALSCIDDSATIRAVLQRGAAGYIPKTCLNQVLVSALRLVMAGGIYVPPDAVLRPGDGLSERHGGIAAKASEPVTADGLGLTERQAEVMGLLAEGRSNKEIARALNLAATTVKAHVGAVLRALKVQSRTQAILALIHHRGAAAGWRQP
jgi:DNA-binding NarL/FixJ family response regulator